MDKIEEDSVIRQVSFAGFDRNVKALELTDFLENEIGPIWRCRLKTSWTPPESYPDFNITNMEAIQRTDDYEKVVPHAFVHFVSPDAETTALNASEHSELVLNQHTLKVNLGPDNQFHTNQKRKVQTFKIPDAHIEIGSLISPDEFLVCWKGPTSGVDFLVDSFDATCKIYFTKETAFTVKGATRHAVIKCDFKMEFSVTQINCIKQYEDTSSLIILLQLASSPFVYYRTAADDIYDMGLIDRLHDEDPWIRTTDFTPSKVLGRSSYYKISVPACSALRLNKAMNYLREHRIPEDHPGELPRIRDELNFGMPMLDHFFCIQDKQGISFEVLFLVNAIMHKGIINQHQLSDEFFKLLKSWPRELTVTALKHIYSYRDPVFDANKRLKVVQEGLLKNPKHLKRSKGSDDYVEVRRLVITPTKAYCLPPEAEPSNRVLRKYKEVADRFLRVSFTDEDLQQLNFNVLSYYVAHIVKKFTSKSFNRNTMVFKRIKTIMNKGFNLCGRKYSFLAFSHNQLRDHSAWFFAEDKNVKVNDIINWMGTFSNRNVARCAARMGQCFTSTCPTVDVPLKEVNLKLQDIKRNGYVFSDGIGKITPDLAMEVAKKLQLTDNPPCAYQIRYAGCKGVIACWPGKQDGKRLSLRPSMNKFKSNHTILEVVSWTRFQPGYLNRQIVTLLSALGVPDDIFSRMQDTMICKLNQMLENTDVAIDVLTSSCGEQGNTAAMLLTAGFKPQTEPHLKGMLSCIRAAQLGGLREKARIFVPSGRWLMGCLDELGILEEGQCFIQVSTPSLENSNPKHGSRFSGTEKNVKVINGIVAIAKNPCLHPGDVRILEAIDVPALHHLVDCLVFPQKGERPHTNEASGSDLDGDQYFATWDESLIPPGKRSCPPMDYAPAEEKKLSRQVNRQDRISFFMKAMTNEKLGIITNAHVALADQSEDGALDKKCIQLAELAATAVDFPKTGKIVTIPSPLKPKTYPDFMGKDEHQSYKSNKILGKLFRQIKDGPKEDMSVTLELTIVPEDIPYDADLEVPGSEDFIMDAWGHKCSYDRQLSALLEQYKVNREEEVVTGYVWSMPKYSNKKKAQLKERLKHAYNALKKEFRQVFETMEQDFQQLTNNEKNAMYEQKASAWYQVAYHPKWVKNALDLKESEGNAIPTMLSFAWIPANYLAQIKIRNRGVDNINSRKPIDALTG